MPKGEFAFGKMYSDELAGLLRPTEVRFIYNEEELDRAWIDLENGSMFPDLPESIWERLNDGSLEFERVFDRSNLVEIRFVDSIRV